MAKKRGKKTVGQKLIEGLRELVDTVERGEPIEEKFTVRTVTLDLQPTRFDAESIRSLRASLNVSQAVFAKIVGASVETIEAWEQGVRSPSPMACRLLEEIRLGKDRWIQTLRESLKETAS